MYVKFRIYIYILMASLCTLLPNALRQLVNLLINKRFI